MSGIFGGGSSSTTGSADTTDQTIDTGDTSSTGGSDLGSLFSNLGQAFASNASATSPAQTVNAVEQATDPTGTIAAQTAISGGQQAPTQQQNQNPQGGSGQQQGQDNGYAPPSAVEQLKKALQGLNQQQRQNPYSFPANTAQSNAAAGQNSPMLNRAARIPTDQADQNPNAPSPNAQNMDFINDNASQPPSNAIDPSDAYRAGLRTNAPDTGFRIPGGPANQNTPGAGGGSGPTGAGQVVPSSGNAPAAQGAGGGPVATQGGTVSGGSGSLAGLAGLARMGAPAAGSAFLLPFMATPAETGEAPTNLWSQRPSGVPDTTQTPPAAQQPPQGDPGARGSSAVGATTTAPATGKPIKTVDPKTGKPVDPSTGAPLPTKKGGETPPPSEAGHGPIMRDISGRSHGAATGLGELAQAAIPLLAMALGGMGGGGGRGRHGFRHGGFGGRGGGFHHGGPKMWPYHHPQMGWRAHGFHPGGGWRPMHPRDAGQFGLSAYGGQDPQQQQIQQLLQTIAGGGQQQGQGGQGQGQRQGQGQGGQGQGGNQWGYAPPQTQGPWSANPFLNTIVGAESSGRNSGGPGGGPAGDGGIARGYYNIQTPTWQQFAKGVPGASQYASADQAPPEVQQAVALTIPAWRFGQRTKDILHSQFGDFSERLTLGELADQFGGQAWATRGKTSTGGSMAANPQGNATPDTTQLGPEKVVLAQ